MIQFPMTVRAQPSQVRHSVYGTDRGVRCEGGNGLEVAALDVLAVTAPVAASIRAASKKDCSGVSANLRVSRLRLGSGGDPALFRIVARLAQSVFSAIWPDRHWSGTAFLADNGSALLSLGDRANFHVMRRCAGLRTKPVPPDDGHFRTVRDGNEIVASQAGVGVLVVMAEGFRSCRRCANASTELLQVWLHRWEFYHSLVLFPSHVCQVVSSILTPATNMKGLARGGRSSISLRAGRVVAGEGSGQVAVPPGPAFSRPVPGREAPASQGPAGRSCGSGLFSLDPCTHDQTRDHGRSIIFRARIASDSFSRNIG